MEFWQLLVGTLSGFIIAFMAEPLKLHFEQKHKMNRYIRALYGEIKYNYQAISSNLSGDHSDASLSHLNAVLRKSISTQCYDYVMKNDPVDFYQIDVAVYIAVIYYYLTSIKGDGDINRDLILQAKRNIESAIREITANKTSREALSLYVALEMLADNKRAAPTIKRKSGLQSVSNDQLLSVLLAEAEQRG